MTTSQVCRQVVPPRAKLRDLIARRNKSLLLVKFFVIAHQNLRSFFYRYYSLSVILGTVALSYGSVPMYKMVDIRLLEVKDV